MLQDLRQIRVECFGEEETYLDFYFSQRFKPAHTLVYQEGKHTVASLTMLPCNIITPKQNIPASYIYAVATLPSFQRRGISNELLRHAESLLSTQEVSVAVLIPASASLFSFYAKQSFSTCFYRRKIIKKIEELPSVDVSENIPELGIDGLWKLRNNYFMQSKYYAQWDTEALQYAKNECELNGGKIIYAQTDGVPFYAFCYPEKNSLVLKETTAEEADLPILVSQIKQHFPLVSVITFYTAPHSRLFEGEGESLAFGMCKSLRGNATRPAMDALPYIGLVLD